MQMENGAFPRNPHGCRRPGQWLKFGRRFFPGAPSLHTRIGLVLTGLAASLLIVLAGLWLHGTRSALHEEIEAASRVSAQWLQVLAGDVSSANAANAANAYDETQLIARLTPLGRVRANHLTVEDAAGQVRYAAPPSRYKAGRTAPAWFAAWVSPRLAATRVAFGPWQVVLTPDPSRAVVDAWDDLCRLAAWAAGLLCLLFLAVRHALNRALIPLETLVAGLQGLGAGRFDARLPLPNAPELARLARAFNGMADRLGEAVTDNVRLESEREVARCLDQRLEAERAAIARELHDELAQSITAVRALAGAIVQRSPAPTPVGEAAGHIVAAAGDMQAGVRRILHCLHPLPDGDLRAGLLSHLGTWQARQGDIALSVDISPDLPRLPPALAVTALRAVQEGLTNIQRHASADRASLRVDVRGAHLEVVLADNGRGLPGQRAAAPASTTGCGLGLAGMAERVAALGGQLQLANQAAGGCRLALRLPLIPFANPSDSLECAETPLHQEA